MVDLQKLKNDIVAKKDEINEIYSKQLFPAKEELIELMNIGAKEICPFKIGDRIIFENKSEGEIQKITYFSIDFFQLGTGIPPATALHNEEAETFDPSQMIIFDYKLNNFSFTWQIEGVRVNKDGKAGKKPFIPKNPFYNKFDENKVFEMTFQNRLDPSMFLDINSLF